MPYAATSQQTRRQIQRLPSTMDNLYKFNTQNDLSEDEDEMYGPEN